MFQHLGGLEEEIGYLSLLKFGKDCGMMTAWKLVNHSLGIRCGDERCGRADVIYVVHKWSCDACHFLY